MKNRYKILIIGILFIAVLFLALLVLAISYEPSSRCSSIWPSAYDDGISNCMDSGDIFSNFFAKAYYGWDKLWNPAEYDRRGMAYPETGSMLKSLEGDLCRSLNGTATNWTCLGVNDICEKVKGDLYYNEELAQVSCSFSDRVDMNCTKEQLDNGWVTIDGYLCYEPFHESILKSRVKPDFSKWTLADKNEN
jgi:hypothetical protein